MAGQAKEPKTRGLVVDFTQLEAVLASQGAGGLMVVLVNECSRVVPHVQSSRMQAACGLLLQHGQHSSVLGHSRNRSPTPQCPTAILLVSLCT